MIDNLTNDEKEVMIMLIQGHNCNIIMEWLDIDYYKYNFIRKSLLKKLGISRITQLTRIALEYKVCI